MIPLSEATGDLGGKANGLRLLAKAGLPVLDAWVIPRSTFAEYLRYNAIQPGDAAAVRTGRLPSPLIAPGRLLAVRSSAVTEDSDQHAKAGAFTTVLGVSPEGFEDAVRAVWASWTAAWTPGLAPDGMTVLIQPLLDARISGVAFSINPLTGNYAELVIEAVWGLGEPLVSGRVVPDRYPVYRPRRIGAREPTALGRLQVASQLTALEVQRGRIVEVQTEAPHARKLLEEDAWALARLVLATERTRKVPVDVEWAMDRAGRLVVLQARPITTGRLPRGESTLWTRRFIGERFPQGVTPLTWSLVGPALEHFIAYPQTSRAFLGGDAPLRLIDGHPYLNVTVFRHLAFKLPGTAPPRFMLDFFPAEEESRWLRRWAAPPDWRVYASIFATTFREQRWRRFRWNPLTNVAAWDAFAQTPLPSFAPMDAAGTLAETDRLLRAYIKIHVTSLLFANMSFEWVQARVPGPLATRILRPRGGSVTRRADAMLAALGRGEVTLEAYLAKHGHRSAASWELWSPRAAESPETVLQNATRLANSRIDVDGEAADTEAAIATQSGRVPALASEYLRLREAQRYWLDGLFWACKQRLQALAPTLGLSPDDLPYLTRAELEALPIDAPKRAAQRRHMPIAPAPPEFLRGDAPLTPVSHRTRLQGLGISPGVAQGTARIARRPEDVGDLRPGEILVAPSGDPSWTHLFARAGGLVLELGSQLSHGAVVAREYGVPAVANIPEATRTIRDGDEVALDGRAGAVWILTAVAPR